MVKLLALFIRVMILFRCVNQHVCAVVRLVNDSKLCSEIPKSTLEELLGASFNPRYMSMVLPTYNINSRTRRAHGDIPFSVDESHNEQLGDEPAWEVQNHVQLSQKMDITMRRKRESNYPQEWHCKSKVVWKDLGTDYFPRFLRTVECISKNCWFNIYKCKPRSFTVKLLKRKKGRCVVAEPGTRMGISGLPKELRELWVWEEHAVNFCCDCSM